MNFALLGADEESLSLVAAARAAGHHIVWFGDAATDCGDQSLPELPETDPGASWEELLDHRTCDAVIVGRGHTTSQQRADQVNQLARNGIAQLVAFPLVDSVLCYYEIDMSRTESETLVCHYNPLLPQPIVDQCAAWVRQGHPQLEAVEQIVWRRPLRVRTRERALWHFARDVELLGQVAGRLNRLAALGSPDQETTYAGLSVQLLGVSQIPVRWEVGPVEQTEHSSLLLVGQRGTLAVDFDPAGRAVQQTISREETSQSESIVPVDTCGAAIESFVKAVETGSAANSSWPSALHAMELADTIEISLRRGRMIDVHNQQLTEQLAFKGAMSAVGCGLLMVLPPLLVFCGWLAEKVGLPVADYWAHLLLALLVGFLAFQILPTLLLKPRAEEKLPKDDAGNEPR